MAYNPYSTTNPYSLAIPKQLYTNSNGNSEPAVYDMTIHITEGNIASSNMPMTLFLKTCCFGECSGISFIDSTPIRVCKNKRIKRNKVFKGIATTGKSTMGWFYGFKLHIIINDKGEILNFTITQANQDDRTPLKKERFLDKIFGKLYADKGYIGKKLFKNTQLFSLVSTRMQCSVDFSNLSP